MPSRVASQEQHQQQRLQERVLQLRALLWISSRHPQSSKRDELLTSHCHYRAELKPARSTVAFLRKQGNDAALTSFSRHQDSYLFFWAVIYQETFNIPQ